jgi:hypothetical protein
MTAIPHVADAGSTAPAVPLMMRIVTVFAADTNAENTRPAVRLPGGATITKSPVAAPVTVAVSVPTAPAAMDAKSSVGVAPG